MVRNRVYRHWYRLSIITVRIIHTRTSLLKLPLHFAILTRHAALYSQCIISSSRRTELIQLHNYERHNFAYKCMMHITLSHSAAHNYALPTNLPTTPTVIPRADTLHAICTQWRVKQTAPTT